MTAKVVSDRYEFERDVKSYLLDRFFDLAFARSLQIDRAVCVRVLKSDLLLTKGQEKFAGRIGSWKHEGIIERSSENHFVWDLVSPGRASKKLRNMKMRPLRQEAIEVISIRAR